MTEQQIGIGGGDSVRSFECTNVRMPRLAAPTGIPVLSVI